LDLNLIVAIAVVLTLGFLVLNIVGSIIGTLFSVMILMTSIYFLSLNEIVIPKNISTDINKIMSKYYTSASDKASVKADGAKVDLNKIIEKTKREIAITGRKAGDEVAKKIENAIK